MVLTPSTRQIAAQVEVVLRHDPTAAIIGIRAQANDRWPARMTVRDRAFSLAWCASPIAVREQLVSLADAGEGAGLVLLTPLDDHALGSDVLARLWRGRVFAVEPWDMLRHAFQAKEIDSRLARWPWVAEALLENQPVDGYPPARGGFLDVDTAWGQVLRTVLGLSPESGARPDLPALLRWSLAPDAMPRYAALPEPARRQIGEWLAEAQGSCGKLVSQVLEAGFGGELAPLGLVCGMVFGPYQNSPLPAGEGPGVRANFQQEMIAARVRMERFTGGIPIAPQEGLRLHSAAVQLVGSLDPSTLMPVLDVADRLLESLHLGGCAHLSNDLPAGFNARLVLLADAISSFLTKSGAESLDAVLAAGRFALTHRISRQQANRARRVEMALRLIRWLAQEDSVPASGLGALVTAYTEDGAFADWARRSLIGGDELTALTRAYRALREAVRIRREAMNRTFGQSLAAWNSAGCPTLPGVIPVENVVSEVLAPAASSTPVLLLVVDGLSYPIFRELLDDAVRQGWNEVRPAHGHATTCGLATIPSVTEISRTSLFCGQRVRGQAANEKTGFAQHPALAPLIPSNRANAKPVVFHKAELTAGGDGVSLSEAVRDAIASRERKVVAIVFNGVDEHLSGSDQLHPRWTLDDLRLIKPILYEARFASRAVLMTADHGHVIDEATHALAGAALTGGGDTVEAGGDRWRPVSGAPVCAEEMLFQGGRVLAPGGAAQVIVPWSETLRYGSRKNGYHGGVSPQEMVVPVAILWAGGSAPAGFRLAPSVLPDWWEWSVLTGPELAQVYQQPAATGKAKPAADARQAALFGPPTAESVSAPAESGDWIAALLASSVFAAQKQWVARAGVKDEEIRGLLEALAERGGKLSKAALAAKLSMPPMRVSGFVHAARRLLNVDQAPVITLDETEGSISLNRGLLETQFREPTP